ncbi:MAG TPA: FIST N-terminal domain-containing protein [Clostridia bacterium]
MLRTAVGHSEDVIVEEAMKEIFSQIHAVLGDVVPRAGILFCTLGCDHRYILSSIQTEFPDIELIGCTTDGEISSINSFTEDSIILMVFASDTIEIHAGMGKGAGQHGKEAGTDAALSARAGLKNFHDDERFAIVLADPLNAGVSGVDSGIEEILGQNFPLIGAASAAHSKKMTTFQFYNDEVLTDSVVLLLFAGPVVFSCGIKGGHVPLGGKEVVTSVNKNVLYRIGDKSALEYFQHYIGNSYNLFMNYCLAVFEKGREGFYVRSAPACDPDTGSVTLNGIVHEGSQVQIGTVDRDSCIDSCTESVRIALDGYPCKNPSAVLIFSCAARKIMLGTQVVKESQRVKEYIGDIPYCGFYAYGEVGPLSKGSKSLFHGTSFITLLIGSDE